MAIRLADFIQTNSQAHDQVACVISAVSVWKKYLFVVKYSYI